MVTVFVFGARGDRDSEWARDQAAIWRSVRGAGYSCVDVFTRSSEVVIHPRPALAASGPSTALGHHARAVGLGGARLLRGWLGVAGLVSGVPGASRWRSPRMVSSRGSPCWIV